MKGKSIFYILLIPFILGLILGLLCLETLLAQWLFECFGFHFSFGLCFLILLAIDFLFGNMFRK